MDHRELWVMPGLSACPTDSEFLQDLGVAGVYQVEDKPNNRVKIPITVKKYLYALILMGMAMTALAQNPIAAPATLYRSAPRPALADSAFPKFDINFPGGPPELLVHVITNQTRLPLNVIIPPESAGTELPPLQMRDVTVPQLFEALGKASRKHVSRITAWSLDSRGVIFPRYSIVNTTYGFRTSEPAIPESIWHFYMDPPEQADVPKPEDPKPVSVCRFYQLGPHLDQGKLRIEDITTAVETAWKMLGTGKTPELKFHKETRLLIAVGPVNQLALIDEVLAQLPVPPAIDPIRGLPMIPPQPGKPLPPAEPIKPQPAQP